jgi:hypothetical protein
MNLGEIEITCSNDFFFLGFFFARVRLPEMMFNKHISIDSDPNKAGTASTKS